MVNTAGKARWCGQAIEDRDAFGPGFQASLMQATPTKRMSGTAQKIHRLPKAIRMRPRLAIRGQHPFGDSPYQVRRRHALSAPRDGLQ